MNKRCRCAVRLWLVAALAGLSIAGGIGLGRIQPTGGKAGLIQFDVISELNMDEAFTHWIVFARYWVCRDYYAVSVLWSEPHGVGHQDMKTLAVLSDETAFRTDDQMYAFWVPLNTTYPRPLGERGPFRWGGAMYELAEMRFAEAEALARRVYVSDLAPGTGPSRNPDGVVDLHVPESARGIQRKLARLKARLKDDRIESMELFDKQRSLCRLEYEYEPSGKASGLSRLVAHLPVRPEKLAAQVTLTSTSSQGDTKNFKLNDVDHLHHRGGRTCTVTYRDVSLGDTVLRLPVQVEVRVSEDKRLLRSARLIDFKRVDLDKAGVWEAARAFGGLSPEDREWRRLADRYLKQPGPKLGPMEVDPNDLAFVRRLVAKYPLPQAEAMPREAVPKTRTIRERMSPEAMAQRRARGRENARRWEKLARDLAKLREIEVEPNDARVMRQLYKYYKRTIFVPLTQEQKTQLRTRGGWAECPVRDDKRDQADLYNKLGKILAYYRIPPLPQSKPPEMDPNDLTRIRQLAVHYEQLATQEDRGLGGRLKAVHALTRLDKMRKDYDAFEGHTLAYLEMIRKAGLANMVMAGGRGNIETLVVAGEYEKANKLMRQWADWSAAESGTDAILRFAGWDGDGYRRDPWSGVHLLDRLLKRPGLSPVQRYKALAFRAVALHQIDKLLADPESAENDLHRAQARWILSTASRADLARKVAPALREALSAWQALGEARWSDAKPYSTANMSAATKNFMGYPDATALQEVSARLMTAIQERTSRTSTRRSGQRR